MREMGYDILGDAVESVYFLRVSVKRAETTIHNVFEDGSNWFPVHRSVSLIGVRLRMLIVVFTERLMCRRGWQRRGGRGGLQIC